jgi:putative transcriptional regulator
MAKKYKSEIMHSVHEMMEGLHERGSIDKTTMREFDVMCLEPNPVFKAKDIRALREAECVSQPVFARYLNVSKNLVSEWERGTKKPSGPSLRLLSLVKRKGLEAII